MSSRVEIDSRKITVAAEKGNVTLSGTVIDREEARRLAYGRRFCEINLFWRGGRGFLKILKILLIKQSPLYAGFLFFLIGAGHINENLSASLSESSISEHSEYHRQHEKINILLVGNYRHNGWARAIAA